MLYFCLDQGDQGGMMDDARRHVSILAETVVFYFSMQRFEHMKQCGSLSVTAQTTRIIFALKSKTWRPKNGQPNNWLRS